MKIASLGNRLADYFAPGATANAYFIDSETGGNPGNYKTFAWGLNDACLDLPAWTTYFDDAAFAAFAGKGTYQGYAVDAPRSIQHFRQRVFVNTYAETAPNEELGPPRNAFQVGVDRILIRTVTHPSAGDPDELNSSHGQVLEGLPRNLSRPVRETWGCFLVRQSQIGVLVRGPDDPAGDRGGVDSTVRRAANGWLIVMTRWGVRGPRQEAQIAFARSRSEATRIQSILREHSAIVQRFAKIVISWHRPPNHEDKVQVVNCLPISYLAKVREIGPTAIP